MSYKIITDELKELKNICYKIVKRIELLETICNEKSREWYKDINERLKELSAEDMEDEFDD